MPTKMAFPFADFGVYTPYSKYPRFLGYDVDPLLKKRYLLWKTSFFPKYKLKKCRVLHVCTKAFFVPQLADFVVTSPLWLPGDSLPQRPGNENTHPMNQIAIRAMRELIEARNLCISDQENQANSFQWKWMYFFFENRDVVQPTCPLKGTKISRAPLGLAQHMLPIPEGSVSFGCPFGGCLKGKTFHLGRSPSLRITQKSPNEHLHAVALTQLFSDPGKKRGSLFWEDHF